MTSSAYDVIIGGHSYNESNNTSKHYYQILLKNKHLQDRIHTYVIISEISS